MKLKKYRLHIRVVGICVIMVCIWYLGYLIYNPKSVTFFTSFLQKPTLSAMAVTSPYIYSFNDPGVLPEAGSMEESWSKYWWLNSGGMLIIEDGVGKTIQGDLSFVSPWRIVYAKNNPTDTDNGYHPQNIFRLISRSTWLNVQQEAYFKIVKTNMSNSPNRNSSNGILLMSRYIDGDNLYYAGLRTDGAAVVKKKIDGVYTTLAYEKIFEGSYDALENPNLIPANMLIGLRSETITNVDGTVTIKLLIDVDSSGTWIPVIETIDDGKKFGRVISREGYTGIRTDFMDVEFERYKSVDLDIIASS